MVNPFEFDTREILTPLNSILEKFYANEERFSLGFWTHFDLISHVGAKIALEQRTRHLVGPEDSYCHLF